MLEEDTKIVKEKLWITLETTEIYKGSATMKLFFLESGIIFLSHS